MRKFLERLRHVVLSAAEDFSKDHSSVCVSSCGVVYFYPAEGARDSSVETDPVEPQWEEHRITFPEILAPTTKA